MSKYEKRALAAGGTTECAGFIAAVLQFQGDSLEYMYCTVILEFTYPKKVQWLDGQGQVTYILDSIRCYEGLPEPSHVNDISNDAIWTGITRRLTRDI
jgi:hypothetical protein